LQERNRGQQKRERWLQKLYQSEKRAKRGLLYRNNQIFGHAKRGGGEASKQGKGGKKESHDRLTVLGGGLKNGQGKFVRWRKISPFIKKEGGGSDGNRWKKKKKNSSQKAAVK